MLSMKLSLITQNSILRMHKTCSFEGTYWLSGMVYSTASGERRKIAIVINQLITQFNPDINMFILRNLPTESAKVHSIASGEKM